MMKLALRLAQRAYGRTSPKRGRSVAVGGITVLESRTRKLKPCAMQPPEVGTQKAQTFTSRSNPAAPSAEHLHALMPWWPQEFGAFS
jgi:hypothetical protein